MTMRAEVLKANNLDQAIFTAQRINGDEEKFAELMELFFSKDIKTANRAAWVLAHCVDQHPWQIMPHLERLIKNLNNDASDAIKRNSVRALQFVDIPKNLWGETIEICFRYLSGSEAIAIKVFAMTVLYNLSLKVPEITNELKIIIEDKLPYESAGFKSRAKKILMKIGV